MKIYLTTYRKFLLFFAICMAFMAVSCDDTKTVHRLPADQIAEEPAEPLVLPEPKTTPAVSGLTVNPAHGQPGHRCDVQVGAPLNGGDAQSPSVFEPINKDSVVSAGKNLNPAHGQPGHNCSVPVGAPL